MGKNRVAVLLIVALCWATTATVVAQNIEDKITVHKLGNGMTFIFAERHEAPVFSAIYGYKVGAVDEVPGITGLAHLFEHMAFKGTPKIGVSDFQKEAPIMNQSNQAGRELSLELVKGEEADQEKIKAQGPPGRAG